jgi:hypothetical protein
MIQRKEDHVPFGIADAVDVSTRVIGLQLDLCPGSRSAIRADRFAIGYAWGFCGGALAALHIENADLYRAFSFVCRQILSERDAVRVLAGIPGMAQDERFQDGEATGMADARNCLESDRPSLGLVLHLSGA